MAEPQASRRYDPVRLRERFDSMVFYKQTYQDHIRMNDSSTLQQIMQEQFTFLLTEEKGIKE
ncbi:hypothetical protein V4S85_17380, partial [Citrobacter freundii]